MNIHHRKQSVLLNPVTKAQLWTALFVDTTTTPPSYTAFSMPPLNALQQTQWNTTTTFMRSDTLIDEVFRVLMSWSDDAIDQLFDRAAGL